MQSPLLTDNVEEGTLAVARLPFVVDNKGSTGLFVGSCPPFMTQDRFESEVATLNAMVVDRTRRSGTNLRGQQLLRTCPCPFTSPHLTSPHQGGLASAWGT